MAKKLGVVRVSITVPADVKKKMDRVGREVNWSAVATQAFIVKLGEIAKTLEKKSMADVIDRLRGSKLQGNSQAYRNGLRMGEEWAKHSADVAELKSIESLYSEWDNELGSAGWDGRFREDFPWNDRGLTGAVFDYLYGNDDTLEERTFWQIIFGDDHDRYTNNPQAIKGMLDGALRVWRTVQNEL